MLVDDCNGSFHIRELHSPLAKKRKMVLPICRYGGIWYSFLINSSPSTFLASRPGLAHLDILLARHLHPGCLSHDSYLSIHTNNIDQIPDDEMAAAKIKCVLNVSVRAGVAEAIVGSLELRRKTQSMMVEALTTIGLHQPTAPTTARGSR